MGKIGEWIIPRKYQKRINTDIRLEETAPDKIVFDLKKKTCYQPVFAELVFRNKQLPKITVRFSTGTVEYGTGTVR